MNKIQSIILAVIIGLISTLAVMAFTGPSSDPPYGNPDFWIKSGSDVYYNPAGGGNVGIGVTDPGTSKLKVVGTIESSSGGFKFPDATTQTTAATAGTNYWTLSSSSLYPTSTTYAIGVGTATLDSNYKITTAGGGIKAESASTPAGYFSSASGYGLIVNSGNVGIGIATPGALLDVQGAAQFGSGNVNLIDSTGKIAGISSTYFASLDGSTITGLNASNLGSGTVPTARLGSGTASASTFLRGDQSWASAGGIPDFVAGDNIEISSDVSRGTFLGGVYYTTYVKLKEIRISRAGTLRVTFTQRSAASESIAYARVYRNGVAVGTEWTTTDTGVGPSRSEDISGWSNGDLVQVYAKSNNSSKTAFVSLFRIKVTLPTTSQLITDGGSANKVMCWKDGALGYCSSGVIADGTCTCNL